MNLKWKFTRKENLNYMIAGWITVGFMLGLLFSAIVHQRICATSPGAVAVTTPSNLTVVSPDLTELASDGDADDLTLPPLLYYPVLYSPMTRKTGYFNADGEFRVIAFYEETRSKLVLWDEEDWR